MEYAHKVENCIIGREYLVAHAKLKMINRCDEIVFVPIIPLKHADLQFVFKDEHYHIDGRFDCNDAKTNAGFDIVGGVTNQIVILDEKSPRHYAYKIIGIEYLVKKCLRKKTGIDPPKNSILYNSWYDTYLGKSCAGKKCPHFGTQMITVKGKTFCPLHNLHADPIKEIIVPIY